jgi:putative methyltransferase (TIGR04325 family)
MPHTIAMQSAVDAGAVRRMLRSLTPPLAWGMARKVLKPHPITFRHGYPSWQAACDASKGYDAPAIMNRVREAAGRVRDGLAACERDGCTFDHIEYSWPLLAGLLHAGLGRDALRVVDFGGALGSTWFQNRGFLGPLPRVDWRIVEQPHYVEVGNAEFRSAGLAFFNTMEEAAAEPVDIVLFCGVLNWIPDAEAILASALATGARFILLDRTLFNHGLRPSWAVQTVREPIYDASYPVQIFPGSVLSLPPEWELLADWSCELQPDPASEARGMLFGRRPA